MSYNDEFFGMSCDPETCTDCNPDLLMLSSSYYQPDNFDMKKEFFNTLSRGTHITFKNVIKFGYKSYIRDGYYVGKKITVDLIRSDDGFEGYLEDSHENMKIYYTDKDKFDICEYDFGIAEDLEELQNPSKNQRKMIEIESKPNLKLNLEHTIFEDYVHSGFGIIFCLDNLS